MNILLNGTLKEVSENIRTVKFPNGEVKMAVVSVEIEDNVLIPIEVWGDRKLEYCRANIGRKGDFICSITGTHSKFTNHDGDEAEISYCRLKMKSALLEWEGSGNVY